MGHMQRCRKADAAFPLVKSHFWTTDRISAAFIWVSITVVIIVVIVRQQTQRRPSLKGRAVRRKMCRRGLTSASLKMMEDEEDDDVKV